MVLVTFLWGLAGVVTRQLETARSFEVTFWRSLFTWLSLSLILPVWQGKDIWRRLPWSNRVFWLSGVSWALMFTSFMTALTLTSVANVLITMALGPLLTACFARVFIGQRLPWRTWLAIAVAGWGMVWMYGSQWLQAADGGSLLGYVAALCVPLAGAAQWTVVQRSQQQGQPIDLVPSVWVGAGLSALATLPLSLPFRASVPDMGWLAFLGAVQLALPCVLSVLCARVLKAPEMALLALLEILFGIGLAWVGAHEVPSDNMLLGGGLVIGALLLNEWLGFVERRQR